LRLAGCGKMNQLGNFDHFGERRFNHLQAIFCPK
jgi:hypothetical protein